MSTPRWIAAICTCFVIVWLSAPKLMETYGPCAVVGVGVLAFAILPAVIRRM